MGQHSCLRSHNAHHPFRAHEAPDRLGTLAISGTLADLSAVPEKEGPLVTAAQVRALTPEEARIPRSVRLRGVYLGGADPEGIAFVIQDETEGIYIQAPAHLHHGLASGRPA